jgi:hypothetical protein
MAYYPATEPLQQTHKIPDHRRIGSTVKWGFPARNLHISFNGSDRAFNSLKTASARVCRKAGRMWRSTPQSRFAEQLQLTAKLINAPNQDGADLGKSFAVSFRSTTTRENLDTCRKEPSKFNELP